MLCRLWVASALCAVVLSAPTIPPVAAGQPVAQGIVTDYFQLVASKVAAGRSLPQPPVCDLNNAVLPVASPTALPGPSTGLTLKHVAIGRGTQNYSCSTNATAAPVALGAIATLFNASCIAAVYPDLLASLPNVALQFNLTSANQTILNPSSLSISGHHFFSNTTTPTFDLDTPAMDLGVAPCSKNNSVTAPPGASVGQDGVGNGAVPWLKLLARDGATGDIEEVYRVNTAGGAAPATCAGMPALFEIQYAAEYWFFESS